jgi:(p)ppGpp synthase/HD superfamily hydrolase
MVVEQELIPYSQRFEEALVYAARVHAVQFRKGTTIPYSTHLLAVAAIVGESDGSEDEVIAALLHDAVEDQGGLARLADIRARFGDAAPGVLRVSVADKLHNARAILTDLRASGPALWARFTGGQAGTLWYYRALVEAYLARGGGPIAEELDRVVTAIEQLATMTD